VRIMRAVAAGAVLAATMGTGVAVAATPELSTSDRLDDRRFVTAGPRAYDVGTEAGRYPAMGFHTRGEMGGIWSAPIKLLDGLWFGIDGDWIGPAQRFTSAQGHVRMDLPATNGIRATRTDFVPGEHRAVLVRLALENPSRHDRTVTLDVDAHSELMSIYPWGETKPFTQTEFNLQDDAGYGAGALTFTEQGRPPFPNVEAHDWAAAVGSTLEPAGHRTGTDFRGPQTPAVICPASGPGTPPMPPRCDDTAYGKGAGGRLTYEVRLRAHDTRTLWFAVAGSETGAADARREMRRVLRDPDRALRTKISERRRIAARTQLDLPGDRPLAEGIDWSKQNLADSVQEARDLEIRETNAGTNYGPAKGVLDRVRFYAAGFPDYPWMFATDGEYTAFASVALGQFEPIKRHMRSLARASRITNGDSGKIVHEVITDGSVYFGSNADAGNTDETAKFPSTVALIWRWTGDDRFLDDLYPASKAAMEYIFRELDADGDGWPEGLGNVERPGMGAEKLDNALYTIRGLFDLADLAEAKGDRATFDWARAKAQDLRARFDPEWWMAEVPQHADSLGDGNARIQQRHWIGVTPMEAELTIDGNAVPGVTSSDRGNVALELRETACYGDDFGLFHTGAPGCDPAQSDRPAERTTFTLNTSIMAVGEGNYGRLGADQQQRFTTANRRLQLPAPDEQPGAMPEIAPSPDYGRSIDKHFNERAMVLQAWGNYGTAWPVVHQQLGVRPDLGRGKLEVVPQLPEGQDRIAGRRIRLAGGSADVAATRTGTTYRITVRSAVGKVRVGHTLPRGATVKSVRLDGRRVAGYQRRETNRGSEITVLTDAGRHEVVIKAG
jgi:hypothetical protein